MGFNESSKIWYDGEMVAWEKATVHVNSHVIHYGSSVFEGIRCYNTGGVGTAIFRLDKHIKRLFDSAKIYRIDIPFTYDEIFQGCIDVIRMNEFKEAYIRPVVFRGYGNLGVLPKGCPINVAISAWEWGKYLGDDAITEGVDVCVSSWSRLPANTMPSMAKAGGNYMNGQLIRMEADVNGYSEGIALNQEGYVSEGSGENVFIVYGGIIYTPPLAASILPGITRDCVFDLAEEFGFEVQKQMLPRSLLYVADEVFFSGTAVEITPVRSIDKIQIGEGKRGPITQKLQERFFGLLNGVYEDRYNWLTQVYT
ncbi:MAG: branched-chain amino acid transaminase [Bacteroidetes bacterium]|nr:branched-chain amino acid transaminase [Bacteroidota bacterium]